MRPRSQPPTAAALPRGAEAALLGRGDPRPVLVQRDGPALPSVEIGTMASLSLHFTSCQFDAEPEEGDTIDDGCQIARLN